MSADGFGLPCPGLEVAEQIIDSFAGAGGASEGIEQGTGREINLAINHDAAMLAIHQANHGRTKHRIENVWGVKEEMLRGLLEGLLVGLLWASFDCRDFSKAKGGKPKSKKIRGLCWWVLRAIDIIAAVSADGLGPRVIMGENVPEFAGYGPLLPNGKRCPRRKGRSFRRWLRGFERRGYKIEWKILRACDYGAPTTRKRLYFIARRDGQPIVWPKPTHAEPKHAPALHLRPYRTAASCINFARPMLSIFAPHEAAIEFARIFKTGIPKRPLEEATERRIARGMWKFVIAPRVPLFLVGVRHHGGGHLHCLDEPMVTVPASDRELGLVRPYVTEYYGTGGPADIVDPLHTVTSVDRFGIAAPLITKFQQNSIGQDARVPLDAVLAGAQRFGVAAPVLVQTGYGERKTQSPRVLDLFKPLGTMVDGIKHGVAAVHLAKNFGGPNGHVTPGSSAGAPFDSVTANDHHALCASNLVVLRNNCAGADLREPMPTACASGNHIGLVQALLLKHAPEGVDLDNVGIINVGGVERVLSDVFFRMLEPRELYRAQGFPDSYVIDPPVTVWNAKKRAHVTYARMPKKLQVRGAGNSVCPPVARALVEANFATPRRAAA